MSKVKCLKILVLILISQKFSSEAHAEVYYSQEDQIRIAKLATCPNPNENEFEKQKYDELKVGHRCRVDQVGTENYGVYYVCNIKGNTCKGDNDLAKVGVEWRLAKREGEKEVWAASNYWGTIYVGSQKPGLNWEESQKACEPIQVDGQTIDMSPPLRGFGYKFQSLEGVRNFEFLKNINYKSVMPTYSGYIWSSQGILLGASHAAWIYNSKTGRYSYSHIGHGFGTRCVGVGNLVQD